MAAPAWAATAGDAGPGALPVALLAGLAGAAGAALAAGLAVGRRRRPEAPAGLAEAHLLEGTIAAAGIGGLVLPPDPAEPPRTFGRLDPADADRLLAAADGEAADALSRAVSRLLEAGEPFEIRETGADGRPLLVRGRLDGLLAVLTTEPTGPASSAVAPEEESLFAAFPHPVWLRGADGRLAWTNAAFRAATGADGAGETLDDLFGQDARDRLAAGGAAPVRVATVAGGGRRILDVIERPTGRPDGALAGVAVDVTELEETHRRLARTVADQAATFDRLATAVAIFGPDRRLAFHNAAYRSLWQLDEAFLEEAPADETILDRLRAARRLPETADWRAFKRQALAAYQAVEAREEWWHLPDGRTLRVVASPNPEGGVTYVYENLTEQLALEARFNALTRTQAETIDNLKEGVATFGPDGLVQLSNPAFAALWDLPDAAEAIGRHVTEIAAEAAASEDEREAWGVLAATVTGVSDQRASLTGRVDRRDGRTLDYASVPLPDGSTLVTFVDVTDTVRVARALAERNQALEEADRLKNAFIEHVSYELRSPLASIIGFTQMLVAGAAGPLTERQLEYAGYIGESSRALHAIVDDVLDLATIDAGIMALEIGAVDLAETARAAAEALQDRIREAGVTLETEIAEDARTIEADEKRVRQILFNILSNAVAHSADGGRIRIAAVPAGEAVVIRVADEGTGIPADRLGTVFERFEADATRGRHRGVGLGLSLVKSFAELHGGTVAIRSEEGRGTEVTVTLPRTPAARRAEAA